MQCQKHHSSVCTYTPENAVFSACLARREKEMCGGRWHRGRADVEDRAEVGKLVTVLGLASVLIAMLLGGRMSLTGRFHNSGMNSAVGGS